MDNEPSVLPPRVVVADDNPTLCRLLVEVLAEAGAEVAGVAADGGQALALVGQLKPDILVLDFEMPVLNGLQVLQALQGTWSTSVSRPLLLVLSSHTEPSIRERCLAAGADDFLNKASDIERLRHWVQRWSSGLPKAPVARREIADDGPEDPR